MTTPDDHDAPPADLLGQARSMIEAAALLISAAEGRLTTRGPVDRADAERDARAAVETHDLAKQAAQAAQAAMYAAVRRLKGAGASRPEISDRLDITESRVKWIVEDKAAGRRARRRRQAEADE